MKEEKCKIQCFDMRMGAKVCHYMSGFECTSLRQYQDNALVFEATPAAVEVVSE